MASFAKCSISHQIYQEMWIYVISNSLKVYLGYRKWLRASSLSLRAGSHLIASLIVVIVPGVYGLGAPEEDADLSPVEKYEALGLVGHVTAEAPSHYAVPRWLVHYVELCFYNLSYFVEHSLLLEGVVGAVNGVLLHSLGHIGVLDNSTVNLVLWLFRQLLRVDLFPVGILWRFTHFSIYKF